MQRGESRHRSAYSVWLSGLRRATPWTSPAGAQLRNLVEQQTVLAAPSWREMNCCCTWTPWLPLLPLLWMWLYCCVSSECRCSCHTALSKVALHVFCNVLESRWFPSSVLLPQYAGLSPMELLVFSNRIQELGLKLLSELQSSQL